MSIPIIARISNILGVDFHILFTLFQRLWAIVAGAILIAIIPIYMDPIHQGYYFTFNSVIALQIFFELGLNFVVVQLVAHEISHLKFSKDGHIEGAAKHISRLASIIGLLRKWYAIASILFVLGIGVIGAAFFYRTGDLPTGEWIGAWLLLIAATGVNLFYSPFLSVLEGTGRVGDVARLRLFQAIVGYILTWCAVVMGAGLWAIVILPLTMSLSTPWWLRLSGRVITQLEGHPITPDYAVRWRTEVLPFQWRIAVSWVSGYFILQIFTPIVFMSQGSVEAGRLGLSLLIFSSIQSLGISWISAKAPTFAGAIAQGRRRELNATFVAVTLRAGTFVLVGSLALVLAVWIAGQLGIKIVSRLSDIPVLASLAVATVAYTFVFAAGVYMRAHKEEPLLLASVVNAILTAIGVSIAARHSVLATVMVYAALAILVSVPWTGVLFVKYFRRTA